MEAVANGEQATTRSGVLARTTMATVLIVAAIAALAITSLIQSNKRATAQSRVVVQPAPSMATVPTSVPLDSGEVGRFAFGYLCSTGIRPTACPASIPGRPGRAAAVKSPHVNGSIVMSELPLPDGRPPRRGEGITSASSHPELVSGDLAIPPSRPVSITSMNRSIASTGSGRTLGMLVIFAVLALSTIVFRHEAPDDVDAEKQKLARACMQWHLAAGAVVSRLVQSTRDADLVQVNDSVFRMRRARRNCEAGWVTLACQDYHAVAASAPGYAMTNQLFPCSRIAASPDDRDRNTP